jgi:hypothetical protein
MKPKAWLEANFPSIWTRRTLLTAVLTPEFPILSAIGRIQGSWRAVCDDSVVRWRSDLHHLLTRWRDGLTLRWPERGEFDDENAGWIDCSLSYRTLERGDVG